MHQWLRQYSFRIEVGIGFFAITLLFSILISWITAGQSAVKAAVANPVDSLRSE
jgi:hypothetical protein